MDRSDDTRRKYLTLQAVDPESGRTCEVLVSYDRMQTVARRSMGHAKECGYLMPMILRGPSAIFEGLRRDEDEDQRGFGWRCYCGIPSHAYHSDGKERSLYPGKVYLVFVNDEQVVYNWRWESADPDDPKLPIDHNERFRARLL